MSAGKLPKEPEVIGSIIITKFSDPAIGLRYAFNGDWLHKEILSATNHLPKEFRRYMTNVRQEQVKETSDES